jgi:DNA polymerase-3 subunit delta
MDDLVYVIAGKEESLVNAHCSGLLDELLEPSQRATALFNADPSSVSASQVLDELRTAPFLTDKRVVLVKGADKFVSEYRPVLDKYFDRPCPTGRLILTVRTWDARTRLAKKLPKVGRLINAGQPSRKELPYRLIEYASDAHDKKLSQNAARVLIELAGDELARLYSEIDKLALFADKEKSITPQHVESLIGRNRLFNAFAVIDAVIQGNAPVAVERLRGMFAQDKSTEYSVIGAFAYHFRKMFNAKVLLGQGLREDQVAKRCNIWSGKDKLFAQMRKTSLKQIGGYLKQLARTDYDVKSGRAKTATAMEQFVLQIAARQNSK